MTGGLVEGAALGALFQEGTKPITNQISKAFEFRETRKKLASLVHRMIPAAKQMKLLDEKLDRPKEEAEKLIEELEQAKQTVNKHSKVPWWKCCCLPCYQGKLHAMEEQIGSSSIVTLMNTARDGKETLSLVRDLKRRLFKRLLDAPVKPDFTVGLDFHLNQLKSWLLSSGVSVCVLIGLGGSGKTTLATLLCWDDQVRGKFGENLLFITVSETPNLKNIVQKLFQDCEYEVPYLEDDDDDDAVRNLRSLLKKIGESCPVMLVLDNVCQGSESFVEAFKVQVPDCKILITSRVKFPRFRISFLKPLRVDDAVTLFRHFALTNDGERGTYLPDEEYVQQVAKVSREAASNIDNYCNHHFVTQHDLIKEIAIHQARQEPYRTRLIFDVNEKSWEQRNQQNTVARTLSISTDKMLAEDWSKVLKAEQVEPSLPNLRIEEAEIKLFITV
ncbi:hypothetical protein P8452_71699 [Trifolium repens]|nr:hypothetical protein P8452_71699 [Trifolium repens]